MFTTQHRPGPLQLRCEGKECNRVGDFRIVGSSVTNLCGRCLAMWIEAVKAMMQIAVLSRSESVVESSHRLTD
jgi:hypothetical protein